MSPANRPSPPSGRSRIYLDNNATTRPFDEVLDAVQRCARNQYGNPGSAHAEGRAARRALEDARESIASILNAHPREVIFTSGGTESINMAIFGLAGARPGAIALTAGEHPATLSACRRLRDQGWRLHTMEVNPDGLLDLEQLGALPWSELNLVTLILAHNETGVIQDVRPVAELCRRHGVLLHLDAVQATGKIAVDFRALGADALSLGAHKFHGPRGIGALLLREGVALAPRSFGGHQEGGRRPGTEPVALAVGMARALELCEASREARAAEIAALRDRLEAGLLDRCAPAVVNGSREHRLPNTLSIAFPGLDGEALLAALDLEGVACSLGSTCASGSAEPAPALVAMGCPPEVTRAAVRFSLSGETTRGEIDGAIERIAGVASRLRESCAVKT